MNLLLFQLDGSATGKVELVFILRCCFIKFHSYYGDGLYNSWSLLGRRSKIRKPAHQMQMDYQLQGTYALVECMPIL